MSSLPCVQLVGIGENVDNGSVCVDGRGME